MDLASNSYEGLKFTSGKSNPVNDALTVEEALQINVNGSPFTVIMRTPGSEHEQVVGLLHAERIIKPKFIPQLTDVETNPLGYITQVNVMVPEDYLGSGYVNSRTLLSVSSCGICGKTELGDIRPEGNRLDSGVVVDVTKLSDMFDELQRVQKTFKQTGGSHGAAALTADGILLAGAEDIGRHNAVDKTVGALILSGKLKQADVLLVSGRLSYEIVIKAFTARIPILAAVSAPGSLAVDFAKELGITLFGFCRGENATCYSWPHRVKQAAQD